MRNLKPLDFVLTDFGTSSLSTTTVHLINTVRTPSHSAPEALTGVAWPPHWHCNAGKTVRQRDETRHTTARKVSANPAEESSRAQSRCRCYRFASSKSCQSCSNNSVNGRMSRSSPVRMKFSSLFSAAERVQL